MSKNSLNISGSSKYPGGKYDDISISGNGKITGDVICDTIDVSGMGKVEGDVNANRISTEGTLKICGDIEAQKISISGMFKCEKSINTKSINISGVSKIEGSLKCESIDCQGMLKVESDIECENLYINGKINCEGFVNCEKFDLVISNVSSSVKELGASYINIQDDGAGWGIFNILKLKKSIFKADVIEGDNIKLSNCEAKIVRGKHIIIGENCNIETVEYSSDIDISNSSKVIKSIKIQ